MVRKISEIYKEYRVFSNLQEHMIRVASVASLLCDNFSENVDKNKVIAVCLLHDMGNLLKVNFKIYPPEIFVPEGAEYWQSMQDEFRKKYGNDEDKATVLIVEELGVKQKVFDLLYKLVLTKLEEYQGIDDLEFKICKYADVRVSPFGVLSLQDRLKEWYTRNPGKTEQYIMTCGLFEKVEKQIFAKCKLKPEDIDDESIAPIVSDLKNFVID